LNAAGNVAAQRPAPVAIDLASISNTVITALNPKQAIIRRGLTMIKLPSWIIAQIGDDFNEVMAYPKIDLPMYQPLEERSADRLLPNINKIVNWSNSESMPLRILHNGCGAVETPSANC
jgi:hypothetical protein